MPHPCVSHQERKEVMTFEGYWVVLTHASQSAPVLESLSRSASDARKKFLAHMVSMGHTGYTWNQWVLHGYSVWCINAGSVPPEDD
jgi:hypothetical protein